MPLTLLSNYNISSGKVRKTGWKWYNRYKMSLFKQKPKTERERVEERRDEVLARGRKFKYPMQYAKHRLIISTVLIAMVAIALMVVAGWAMLYKFQDTGDMLYRVTQIFPVPVAKVEGASVRYSDYLMIYRSNLMTAEQQGGQLGDSADAEAVREGYKQAALQAAIEYTFALKLGKELGVEVTDEEISEAFEEHRKVGGVDRSEEGFLKILRDNFGMNRSEYRRMLYLSIMQAKVAQAVDTDAQKAAEAVEAKLAENGNDLRGAAQDLGMEANYQETGRLVDNMNVDSGRSAMAMKLEVGQVSERFLSSNGDGYYYVKLNDKTTSQVNYASLKIDFTKFDEMVADLYADDDIDVYIEIGQLEPTE